MLDDMTPKLSAPIDREVIRAASDTSGAAEQAQVYTDRIFISPFADDGE